MGHDNVDLHHLYRIELELVLKNDFQTNYVFPLSKSNMKQKFIKTFRKLI